MVLEGIFHLLSGYVEFQVRGDGARFFSIAAKRGFGFWGFRRVDGKAVARVKPGAYKKIRPVCRRCQVSTRILRRRGLPFHLRRLGRRKGLLAGALAGAALYWFLSGFIWGVGVSGQEFVTPREILDAAQAQGVFVGASRESFSPKNAGSGIIAQVPKLSWAAVNTDGCFVEIAVKEGTAKPQVEDTGEFSNIVASREGQIVAVEAQEGRPEVKPGDIVTKGQLLIAGLYQEVPDPYGPQPEKLYQRAGPARGRVVAETYREFTVQVGAAAAQEIEGPRQERYWLEVFGLRIPLGIWSTPEGKTRSYTEVIRAQALDVELPLAFERQVVVSLTEEQRTLTKKEQQTAALQKLREAQKAALPKGSSVVEEKLEYSWTGDMCLLSARCRCREEIGELRVISVK